MIKWDDPFDCGPTITPVHWLRRPNDNKKKEPF
jgi:hypothetical protein